MATAEYTPSPFPCSIVVVQTTGRRGKTFKFERKNWCVLGANKDCDIIVPFPGVAQLQALIHVKLNGVFLQGIDRQNPVRHPRLKKALLDEEEVLLLPGDVFLLGNREFLIDYNAEDVCIEANDAIAQALSAEGSSGRKTTPRLRRRRKSSIMVGEFDETYVLPTNGSEKLLSETQLARVSRSEVEILPQHEEQPVRKDRESLPPHASSQKPCSEEEIGSRSLSSDDSAVFDEQGSVSRIIKFDSTNKGPQESETCREERIPAKSASRSKIASQKKQKRNLVFERLSKGLSATPRKREIESAFGQHESRSQTTLNATASNRANIASGKENVPLHETAEKSDVKKDKDVHNKKDFENAHSIRSPLANRVELENQASPQPKSTRTPSKKGLLASAKSRNVNAQTPRSRSVAFSATIELAPGAHYSPFRPRKMTTMSGNATRAKRQAKETSKKVTRSASLVPKSRPAIASSSASQKEARLLKKPVSSSGPVSNSKQFGKVLKSEVLSTNTYRREAKPIVEYEDDCYPPTPSSSEEENEAPKPPAPSEPSPMARVGGALAGFLKRLSGNFESDQEDDSSSETNEDYAHKRLSFSEDLNESAKTHMPSSQSPMSSEPLMSSVELQELSQTVPPEKRRDFVNQVLSAANDVRKVTNPVSTECHELPLSSDEEKSVTQGLVQKKEENVCLKKLPTSERDSNKSSLEPCGSDSTKLTTAYEKPDISVEGAWRDTSKEEYQDDGTITNESIGSEGHSSIDSDGTERLECSRSTSLEVSDFEGDTPELEMEMRILHNVNVNDQLDETDDENAVERDYGDDPWDDLDVGEGNESDEREVAAVVLDDEVDIQLVSGFGLTRSCEKKIESEVEQLQSEKPRDEDEDEDSSHERNLHSTARLSKDHSQEVSSLDQDSNMSDSSSATDDEKSSAEFDLSSTSSTGKALQKYATEVAGGAECSAGKEMEDSSRTTIAVHHDETEASRRELSRLKKDELKKRLAQRGLNVEGLKKDLVERLARAMMSVATISEGEENLSESESQCHQKSDEEMIDQNNPSEPSTCHITPKRSKEHILGTTSGKAEASTRRPTRRLTRRSLAAGQATASSPETPKAVPEVKNDVESKDAPDISLYRRRTMRELRQLLKDRGLDTQLKMRKDELIQHLISHSIGSDGQDLKKPNFSDAEKLLQSNKKNTRAQKKSLPKEPVKSSQKMTVAQIRALLREQGQCQAGTKNTLLERLSTQPERRTRSRRVLDSTSCELCQAGQMCEAAAKN